MVSPRFNPKQGGLGTAFLTTMLYRVEHKGLGKKMQGTCKRGKSDQQFQYQTEFRPQKKP